MTSSFQSDTGSTVFSYMSAFFALSCICCFFIGASHPVGSEVSAVFLFSEIGDTDDIRGRSECIKQTNELQNEPSRVEESG